MSRLTALSAILTLLAIPGIGAEAVEFGTPANVSGTASLHGDWLVISTSAAQIEAWSWQLDGGTADAHAREEVTATSPDGTRAKIPGPGTGSSEFPMNRGASTHPGDSGIILLKLNIAAAAVSFNGTGQLITVEAGHFPAPEAAPFWWLSTLEDTVKQPTAGLLLKGTIDIAGLISHFEVFRVDCQTCPDSTAEQDYGATHSSTRTTWSMQAPAWANLSMTAEGYALGAKLDIDGVGGLRLPSSPTSVAPGTFSMAGKFRLANMSVSGPDALAGDLDVFGARTFLDEDAGRPPAAGTVAAGIGIALVGIGLIAREILRAPLQNPTREKVFNSISANPGIHFRELKRQTGLATGSLSYCLHVLASAKLVSKQHYGRKAAFYAGDTPTETAPPCLAEINTVLVGAIMQQVQRDEPLRRVDLVRNLSDAWPSSTVYRTVKKLQHVGVLCPGSKLKMDVQLEAWADPWLESLDVD